MEAHTIEKYKKWTIEIHYDNDNPESPRDWDNLGTMACWHRRMNLGDKPEEIERFEPIEWMRHELIYNFESQIPYPEDSYCEDWLMEDDERTLKYFNQFYVQLPIHAYEHSGITISSGRYSDMFDSGQLGFIYVSKKDAMKEFSAKRWSKKLEDKILKILDGEIETYDQYLTGDVHGFMIYRPEDVDCEDSEDSCWGFYDSEYAMEEAKSIIDWHVKTEKAQKRLERKIITKVENPVFAGI
jgi:hypothetical protein